MTKHPVALAIAFALSLAVALPGCDSTANLTEQEHIQRAKDFEDKGNFKGSIVELKNAIQKNPNSPQARLLLGQVYLKAGMGAEAEKELSQAEKLGVNPETIKPQLGEALLLMGEYKRVLDDIQPSEKTSQTNLARILQIRADAMLKQGMLKEGCSLFQQSLDTATNNAPTYWGLAQCAIAEHDMPKARQWLDAALKINERQAQTWSFIGDWEQLNKNSPAALAAYTRALGTEPNNLKALQDRATLNIAMGRLEQARQDLEKIQKLAPKSLGAIYLQALYDFQQKKFPETRDGLQEVLKLAPDHMPSVLLAGTTAYALGSYQQSESHLQRFLARFPGHAFARRIMAATQIKLNQPDKALETLAPLLAPGTHDAQALAMASDAYRAKGENQNAAALLERAALIDPKSAAIQTQLGLTHLTTGDSLLAITKLESAAALDTNQYKAESLLAQTYLNRREFDKALVAIDALEKKLKGSAITHNLRGNAYLGKNDQTNARKSFELAVKTDPRFFPAVASLAQLDLADRKPELARQRFERMLENDKGNLQAMMALAGVAAMQKQDQDYVGWLKKAEKAHPQAMPPRTALVAYYLGKHNFPDAMAVANEAVNLSPDSPEALTLLGNTQMAVGDRTKAVVTFAKLAQKTDYSPDAFLQLAMAQVSNKQYKEARVSLQKALKLKADHLPSQEAMIRLEMTENKPEAALQIARVMQAQHPKSPLGYDREGDLHLAQNQIPQAVAAYQQALDKGAGAPGFVKLFRAQVITQPKVAEQRLNDWIQKSPRDAAVRAYAAEYFMRNGRNKEAIAQYEMVNRLAPNKVISLNNLANLYARENDSRALATAELAFKLAPENSVVQDTLGWILVGQGQAPRGLALLSKALAKAPKNPAIRYHHAAGLALTGNKAQARKEIEALLADKPQFSELGEAQALLKRL
ncbi:MAG: PEP-CTERM system TPR-repeat protein PrsT [Thiobacillus sp.]|nr:PEP-CTERM system TPR-repeat protein PrsT [Thiobacillus sp.]